MASMIKRHYHRPHEVVCITDDPVGINPDVKVIPIWEDPFGMGRCWRRLKLFAPEMKQLIGGRFVSIDLDAVIVDDITPLFNGAVGGCDFRIWGEYWRKTPYCGSLMMMKAGRRSWVWDTFVQCHREYTKDGRGRMPYGSDQDHISRCLFPGERMWTMRHGIHNFNFTIRKWGRFAGSFCGNSGSKYHTEQYAKRYAEVTGKGDWKAAIRRPPMVGNGKVPLGARIIFFNGQYNPSDPDLQREYPWIKEHWTC